MNQQNYTATLVVDAKAADVFNHINGVRKWWTTDLEGHAEKLGDEFTVTFADMHVSTHKLVEVIANKKVVWLVTKSNLSFIKDKNEWTNTTISFEIAEGNDKTELLFTHVGLLPEVECYYSCSKGWDYFIKGSLFKLITEGKGTPGLW